tara:strand:- start:459 stop:1223 length:765 start_codon:yes stop_codon:yes gene_type:complete
MTKAKKSLGQNFLVDGKVISEIINHVNPDSSDIFLEIGPGKGAITRELISKAGLTHAVEIDDILSKELSNFEDKGDFIVHHEDILNFDPSKLSHRQIRLIGNLPYNISTPIMFWSFKNINFFEDMHFMFQKEFGERLFASNNSKNFGRLTVITQYLTNPYYCFSITSDSFSPKPKVDSVFLRLEPIKGRKYDDPIAIKLQEITQIAFMHKRKMVGKSLEKVISNNSLNELNIDGRMRPENISVEDYIKIAETLI